MVNSGEVLKDEQTLAEKELTPGCLIHIVHDGDENVPHLEIPILSANFLD